MIYPNVLLIDILEALNRQIKILWYNIKALYRVIIISFPTPTHMDREISHRVGDLTATLASVEIALMFD